MTERIIKKMTIKCLLLLFMLSHTRNLLWNVAVREMRTRCKIHLYKILYANEKTNAQYKVFQYIVI